MVEYIQSLFNIQNQGLLQRPKKTVEIRLNEGHNLPPTQVGIGLTYLPKNCGDVSPASLLCCYSFENK